MPKTRKDRIAGIELELERLESQRKQLVAQEREAERKARTGRLCRRMGLLESMMPDTIQLDDERFKAFLHKTVNNDFGKKALATLVAEQKAAVSADGAKAPEQKPAKPAPNGENQPSAAAAKGDANGADGNDPATG
jgi:hypothetical protein